MERLRVILGHRMRSAWAQHTTVICPRCLRPITPGQAWDIGHTHDVHTHPHLMWDITQMHPEHASCNRADGAATTNRLLSQRRARLWRW